MPYSIQQHCHSIQGDKHSARLTGWRDDFLPFINHYSFLLFILGRRVSLHYCSSFPFSGKISFKRVYISHSFHIYPLRINREKIAVESSAFTPIFRKFTQRRASLITWLLSFTIESWKDSVCGKFEAIQLTSLLLERIKSLHDNGTVLSCLVSHTLICNWIRQCIYHIGKLFRYIVFNGNVDKERR